MSGCTIATERAVDDADDRKHGQRRRKEGRGLREERKREPDQPVGTHLQEDAGQDHRAGCRGLDVRVRQPGMKGEQRHLDGKRQRKCGKQPQLQVRRDVQVVQLDEIEAVGATGFLLQIRQRQNRQQHQHAAGHRVQDELHRGVNPPVVAPDADEKVHRDQHRVPEHVEQEQIERDEHANHRALEQQDDDAERSRLVVHRFPGTEEGQRRQEARQDEQEQADAVDADEVADAERRNPLVALDELEVGGRPVEPAPQQQRFREHQKRDDERDPARERRLLLVAADEQQKQRAGNRQRDEGGQYWKRHQS
jgi:hypothetical protein